MDEGIGTPEHEPVLVKRPLHSVFEPYHAKLILVSLLSVIVVGFTAAMLLLP